MPRLAKMVYKTTNVVGNMRMTGQTLGEKLLGAFRRTVTGESLFVTYFHADITLQKLRRELARRAQAAIHIRLWRR